MAKGRRKVKIIPPMWWVDGYDYATAERGVQVPAITKQESIGVKVIILSEGRKKRKYAKIRDAALLRAMYRD